MRSALAAVSVVGLLAFAAATSATRADPEVLADFEDGTTGSFRTQESSDERITLVRDVDGTGGALEGDRSAQIRCGPEDQGVAGAGRAWRTELRASAEDTSARPGSRQRWSWYLRIGSDLQPPPEARGWVVLSQFHSGIDRTSPQLAIELTPADALLLRARGGDPDEPAASSVTLLDQVRRGHTYLIEQEIDWSTGPAGRVETWIDGRPAPVHEGANAYVGAEAYLKLGCYRSDSAVDEGTLWVDRVERRGRAGTGPASRTAAVVIGSMAVTALGALLLCLRRRRTPLDVPEPGRPVAGGASPARLDGGDPRA